MFTILIMLWGDKYIFQCQTVANYIPYSDLSNYINSLDIDILLPLCRDLVSGSQMQHKPLVGMFRVVCEYIQRLAMFYLTVNQS